MLSSKGFDEHKILLANLYVWGSAEMDQLPMKEDSQDYVVTKPRNLTDLGSLAIRNMACGALHTAVCTHEGDIYTFGCNDDGALGRDTKEGNEKENIPAKLSLPEKIRVVTCGDSHTAFLSEIGSVFLAGAYKDSHGNIGFPNFLEEENADYKKRYLKQQIKPVKISSFHSPIMQIRSGENHTACMDECGCVWVWGSNEFGCLLSKDTHVDMNGNSSSENETEIFNNKVNNLFPKKCTPESLGMDAYGEISNVFCGGSTTFILMKKEGNFTFFGCGRNSCGEVGTDSSEDAIYTLEEVKGLRGVDVRFASGGQFFSVAIDRDCGRVYTWGKAEFTGLGKADGKVASPEVLIFPPGKDTKINFVSCGSDHTLAISHGALFTWGAGQNYQLGNGNDCDVSLTPYFLHPKDLNNSYVLLAAGGSQHSVAAIWNGLFKEEETAKAPAVRRAKRTREENVEEERKAKKKKTEEEIPSRRRRTSALSAASKEETSVRSSSRIKDLSTKQTEEIKTTQQKKAKAAAKSAPLSKAKKTTVARPQNQETVVEISQEEEEEVPAKVRRTRSAAAAPSPKRKTRDLRKTKTADSTKKLQGKDTKSAAASRASTATSKTGRTAATKASPKKKTGGGKSKGIGSGSNKKTEKEKKAAPKQKASSKKQPKRQAKTKQKK